MKWCIPNTGSVVLILDPEKDGRQDKINLLRVLEYAADAGVLRGDLAKFLALLRSHIELEAALAREAA